MQCTLNHLLSALQNVTGLLIRHDRKRKRPHTNWFRKCTTHSSSKCLNHNQCGIVLLVATGAIDTPPYLNNFSCHAGSD